MFKMEFKTDNAAFFDGGGDPDPYEVARILRVTSGLVLNGFTEGSIKDANGNTVGSWEYNS